MERVRLGGTGAYLRRRADLGGAELARFLAGDGMGAHGEAALFFAVLLPAAVALLAGLDDAVAADGRLRLCGGRQREEDEEEEEEAFQFRLSAVAERERETDR